MLLDALQKFEWLIEPAEIYLDTGLKVVSSTKTDFWQSYREDFHKDNGHLFFSSSSGDFELNVKWSFSSISDFSQCGLMIRTDEFNWFKISIMAENSEVFVGSSVTNFGTSDLAIHSISSVSSIPTAYSSSTACSISVVNPSLSVGNIENIWYRLVCKDGGFTAYYSFDGINYQEARRFDLLKEAKTYMAGAYICCPSENKFSALLENIEVT